MHRGGFSLDPALATLRIKLAFAKNFGHRSLHEQTAERGRNHDIREWDLEDENRHKIIQRDYQS